MNWNPFAKEDEKERVYRLDAESARAKEASAVLDNELYKEAFAKLEAEYVGVWKNSPDDAYDLRDEAYRALKNLDRTRQHLENVINTGKMANKELDSIAKERKSTKGEK